MRHMYVQTLCLLLACQSAPEIVRSTLDIAGKVDLVCQMALGLFPGAAPIETVCSAYRGAYYELTPAARARQGEIAMQQVAAHMTALERPQGRFMQAAPQPPGKVSPAAQRVRDCADAGRDCREEARALLR